MWTAQPSSREALATLLWPEHDSGRARANLRRTLYHLNQAIGEHALIATGDTIARNMDAELWMDVEIFQRSTAGCLDEINQEINCLDKLEAALALYRDDFLAGFTLPDSPGFDDWQFFEREALRRALSRVLITLATIYQEQNKWDEAIGVTRRWVSLDPLHEAAHRHLMQLYALAGEQSAALRQYDECVRILDEELGLSPEAETTVLFEAIQTRRFAPATVDAAPPAPLPAAAQHESNSHVLPLQATPFIGREHELALLADYLTDPQMCLISIVGPGGIGKTRLALAAADQITSGFTDGIRFIPLASVVGIEHFFAAVAQGIGYRFHGSGEPEQQLLNYLSSKHMLLLLDNFEHMLDCATFVAQILQVAPNVKMLVTSRERLNLSAETVINLGGLSYFDWTPAAMSGETDIAAYESVRLFLHRAKMLQPDLQLQATDYAHVARICHLVQGMPLALNLAAGWVDLLSLEEIADEIAKSFDFLESDERDLPDRQRSVRATFAYSWERLSSQEQRVLSKLSIFRGGFTRQAALAAAEADLNTLRGLNNKSFLALNQTGRYGIHELLRQYAEAQLARDQQAVAQTADAHSHYFANFLHDRLDSVQRYNDLTPLLEIRTELSNIRVAWRWAVRHARTDDLALATGAFFYFCNSQSLYEEGESSLTAAATCLRTLPPSRDRDLLLAYTLTYCGWMCLRLGKLSRAREALDESINLYERHDAAPPLVMASEPRTALGVLQQVAGDYEAAYELGEAAYQLSEDRLDPGNLMFACYVLANAAYARGDYEPAETHAQQAYRLANELDMFWFMAYILNDLGNIAHALARYERAGEYYEQSYALREQQYDPEGMAAALNLMGKNAVALGEYTRSQELYRRAEAIYREINDRGGLATALGGLGQTEYALGNVEMARKRLHQALEIATAISYLPLTFAILIHVAELLLEADASTEGLSILSLVSHHTAAEHITRVKAQERLKHFEDRFTSSAFEQAIQRGQTSSPESIVDRLKNSPLLKTNSLLVAELTTDQHVSTANQALIDPLTERELEVLALMAQGLTNQQIAERLVVVLGTVKSHGHNIYSKLGVSNRVQAVARAQEVNLL